MVELVTSRATAPDFTPMSGRVLVALGRSTLFPRGAFPCLTVVSQRAREIAPVLSDAARATARRQDASGSRGSRSRLAVSLPGPVGADTAPRVSLSMKTTAEVEQRLGLEWRVHELVAGVVNEELDASGESAAAIPVDCRVLVEAPPVDAGVGYGLSDESQPGAWLGGDSGEGAEHGAMVESASDARNAAQLSAAASRVARPLKVLEAGVVRKIWSDTPGSVPMVSVAGSPVIATGGSSGALVPVGAVVDEHAAAAVLASDLEVDILVLVLSDDEVASEFSALALTCPAMLDSSGLSVVPASMKSAMAAASSFLSGAQRVGRAEPVVLIGGVSKVAAMMAGDAGTVMCRDGAMGRLLASGLSTDAETRRMLMRGVNAGYSLV